MLLTFGVPLEDIFLNGNVHPKLEALYSSAYSSIIKSCIPPEYLIQQTINEARLYAAKEKFLNFNESLVNEKPSTILLLIREFLKCLPISLLPFYAQKKKFNWHDISLKCKYIFQHYRKTGKINFYLDTEIAKVLIDLPECHYKLLNCHITFLKKICSCVQDPKINRKSLIKYSKFYTPVMFFHPFECCGIKTCKKNLIHFTMYIIIRWHSIKTLMNKNLDELNLETNLWELLNIPYQNLNNSSCSSKTSSIDLITRSKGISKSSSSSQNTRTPRKDNCTCNRNIEVSSKSDIEHPNFISTPINNSNNLENKKDSSMNSKFTNKTPEESNISEAKYEEFKDDKTKKSTEPIKMDGPLIKRISKLGWTYTPNKTKLHSKEYVGLDGISNKKLLDSSIPAKDSKTCLPLKNIRSKLSFLKINKNKVNAPEETTIKYKKMLQTK